VASDLPALMGALPDVAPDSLWPSAALAASAARTVQRRVGADYVLAVIGTMQAHETFYSDERGESYLALLHPNGHTADRTAREGN